MVTLEFDSIFKKRVSKIKDKKLKAKVKKQIIKKAKELKQSLERVAQK